MGLTDRTRPHVSHYIINGECQYCKANKENPFDMLKLLSPCKHVPLSVSMEIPDNDNSGLQVLECA